MDYSNFFLTSKEILEKYNAHIERLKNTYLVFKDRFNHDKVIVVRATNSSRYFSAYWKRKKRELKNRLGNYAYVQGLLLTLTVDVKKIVRDYNIDEFVYEYIIDNIYSWFSEFVNRLNSYRLKRGVKNRLDYIAILELQKNGNPHLHVVFPGLKYLASYLYLSQAWDKGYVYVQGSRGRISLTNYILKYMTKLKGYTEYFKALMYVYRVRWYSFSKGFFHRLRREVNYVFLRKFELFSDVLDYLDYYKSYYLLTELDLVMKVESG